MPSRSSDMTEQESGKRELSMASKAPKAEVAAEELIAERLPDEVEASVEVTPDPVAEAVEAVDTETHTDAVGEATAQVVEADAFAELIETGRERLDAIDDQILELVERRIAVAGGLLAAKHARRIDLRDKLRQVEMHTRLTAAAETLNQHQVRELYELFIRLGVEHFRKTVIDGRRGR